MLQKKEKNLKKIIEFFNWKKVYIDQNLLNEVRNKNKKMILLFNRSYTILPQYCNKNFKIYNGKIFTNIKLKLRLVGYKFGAFSYTRNSFKYKWLRK